MKHRIEYLTYLFLFVVILLAGCSGCDQEPTHQGQVELPTDDTTDVEQSPIDVESIAPQLEKIVPPPKLTRDQLPEALPYPMTNANQHVWSAMVTEAVKDQKLMEQLLPDTIEKAFKANAYSSTSVEDFDVINVFKAALWRKMERLYPNNGNVIYEYLTYVAYKPHGSRAEKEHFVDVWERLKRINDEEGVHIASSRRHTYGLSRAYTDLGEYDKAVENIKEQNARKDELRRLGLSYRSMHLGTMRHISLVRKIQREEEEKNKKRNQEGE